MMRTGKSYIGFLFLLVVVFVISCTHEIHEQENEFPHLTKVTYDEDMSVFANPERGFYTPIDFFSPSEPIQSSLLESCRAQGRSLLYLGYYLTDYMNSEISQEYIDFMQANFDALRAGGMKCVLRYAYKDSYSDADHPWDADVDVVLKHVSQLKALWQSNSDVILCLQSGFIGSWGEWYYTDHFVFEPSTQADFNLRKQVVYAQLDALPPSRQIALRTPFYKRMLLGLSHRDTITLSTAFNCSPQARLSGHNDCFLAADDDCGTFIDVADRQFWESDSRYTIMGGETCNPCKYSRCANALTDLELQHWTYMNIEYHPKVINGWRRGGCFDEIERRLGYRLLLRNAYHSPLAVAGGRFRVVLDIENCGFAAPVNPRDVEFVLVGDGGDVSVIKVDEEPRRWFAGETHRIDCTFTLPDKSGSYTLYLNLPDPELSIRNNPLFSIRLANKCCWEASTGYNKLFVVDVE